MSAYLQRPPSREDVQRVLAERSLSDYTRQAWHVVEPATPYVHGWHIDAIAEHLEAVLSGQIRHLIINIPPRHMKSLEVCVFMPTWAWIRKPHLRFLTSSYAATLSTRDAVKSRRILQSPWYRARWGHVFQLAYDQNQKQRYENNRGGYRIATSVGGTTTGEGGDILLADDPHNARKIHSATIRENDLNWWKETWSTRMNDPKTGVEIIVMQRLHERDLTGYILAEVGGYEHLCLPARHETDRHCATSIGWSDPRKERGELLWSERMDETELAKLERKLGPYGTAGQLQQRPSPTEGGILKRWWWRFWIPKGARVEPVRVLMADGSYHECPQVELPDQFSREAQSWDMAFKGTADSAYVAGQAWGQRGPDYFLLDQIREKLDLPGSIAAVREMTRRRPKAITKWIEDKANGPAVIQSLRKELPGLMEVSPKGSKEGRAHAISPFAQAGNVYLPHPALYPWVRDFIEEATKFPNGTYKDQVDAMDQAILEFEGDPGVLIGRA